MKFRGAKVSFRRKNKCELRLEDGTKLAVWVSTLPIGYDTPFDIAYPEPQPPVKGILRSKDGAVVFDHQHKPIVNRDYTDDAYLLDVKHYQQLRTLYIDYIAIVSCLENELEFEVATEYEDKPIDRVFLEKLFVEFQEAGCTSTQLLQIGQMISEINQEALDGIEEES